MIVKNAERQTVFEYMMGIILANNGFSSALVNQYVVFNLKNKGQLYLSGYSHLWNSYNWHWR